MIKFFKENSFNIILFVVSTSVFYTIFGYLDFYFSQKNENTNFDIHTEPVKNLSPISKERLEEIKNEIKTKNEEKNTIEDEPELNVAPKEDTPKKDLNNIIISFILENYKDILEKQSVENINIITDGKTFFEKVSGMKIDFIEKKEEVRGKMKNGTIMLFAPHLLGNSELLSVFLHETGHYVDLYFLKKDYFGDISNNFYDISWNDIKVIKAGQSKEDFVSGYAMTNKYEDFAESFEYFILHNNIFKEKSQNSTNLKEKYDFFT